MHATIAGVVIGLLDPGAVRCSGGGRARSTSSEALHDSTSTPTRCAELRFLLRESVSVAERLRAPLHPVSATSSCRCSRWPTPGVRARPASATRHRRGRDRRGRGPGGRQARRRRRCLVAGGPARVGPAARRRRLAEVDRHGRARRHRLHRVDVRRRAGVKNDDPVLVDEAKIGVLAGRRSSPPSWARCCSGRRAAGRQPTHPSPRTA